MQIKVNGNLEDISVMLVSAERYAMRKKNIHS